MHGFPLYTVLNLTRFFSGPKNRIKGGLTVYFLEGYFFFPSSCLFQGRNQGNFLAATSVMVGRICPPWLG